MTTLSDLITGATPSEVQAESTPPPDANPKGNPYEGLLDEPSAQQGNVDQYGALAQDMSRQQLRTTMVGATSVNADRFAQAKRDGDATGVPADVAYRNPEVGQQAKLNEYDKLLNTSPILADALRSGDFAKLAHDDTSALSQTESVTKGLGKSAALGVVGWGQQALSFLQAAADFSSKYLTGPLARWGVLPEDPAERAAAKFARDRKAAQDAAQWYRPKSSSILARGAYGTVEGVVNLAPALLSGGETALPLMAGQSGLQAYGDARDAGKSPEASLLYAGGQAAITYYVFKLPIGRLFGDIGAGTPFMKKLAGQLATLVPASEAQTVLSGFANWAALHRDKPLSEFLKTLPAQMQETLVTSLMMAGGFAGLGHIAGKIGASKANAARAQADAERLASLTKASENSKLRARSPETFADFVQSAANEDAQHVYVDAKTMQEALQQSPVPDLPKAVVEQMDPALRSGSDIQVPIGEYAAKIAPTDAGKLLLDHIKTTPDGMSAAEARAFYQSEADQLQQQVEQYLQPEQQAQQGAHEQGVAQVQADVAKQLTDAGVEPKTAEAYAQTYGSAFRSIAERAGIDPAALYERYGLRITREGLAPQPGETTLQQIARTPATNDEVHSFAQDVQQRYGLKDFAAWVHAPTGDLHLAMIEVPQGARKQGVGSKAMQDLTQFADAHGMRITLTPGQTDAVHKTTSRGRLVKFYKRFGFVENKGRNKDFRISEGMYRDPKGPDGMSLDFTQYRQELPGEVPVDGVEHPTTNSDGKQIAPTKEANDAFWRWFGDSKAVDDEGRPVELYHGTTADFTHFSRDKANAESDFGAGFYFTNTKEDVSHNYAGEGPDLTNRIQQAAERIAQETDRSYDDPAVIAEAKASVGVEHGGVAMPVYLSMKNPVEVGGPRDTTLDYSYEYEPLSSFQKSDVKELRDQGLSDEEIRQELSDQNNYPPQEVGKVVDFVLALRNNADANYDGKVEPLIDEIMQHALDYGGIKASEIYKLANKSEEFAYYTDENGVLTSKEILRQSFEDTGYDGIIDHTVNQKFGSESEGAIKYNKGMAGMHEETVHYIAFHPQQIKSAIGNVGVFDPVSGDILAQSGTDRARIRFGQDRKFSIDLLKNADLSSFIHESGHFWLEVLGDVAKELNVGDASKLNPLQKQLVADYDSILKWLGAKPGAKIEEAQHEQFARGIEAYFMEGKAPDVALQSAFARFRAWMINIYKSLSTLNVHLTDEVRSVFDRMLASEERIKDAEASRGYAPMFESAKQAGMSESEWNAYQALGKEATDKAITDLETKSLKDMKWLSNARSKALKKVQASVDETRHAIRDEVSAIVSRQPIYMARDLIQHGTLPEDIVQQFTNAQRRSYDTMAGRSTKLDTGALRDMFGDGPAAPWRYLPTTMIAKDGVHPDDVAPLFGMSSGDELVRKLVATEPKKNAIDSMTDKLMLERHGDITDEASMQRAADAAIHNDVRARFIATELNALAKATGGRKILAAAAKNFAEQTIARKAIREIKPAQYAAQEARAARSAEQSLKAGNIAEAAMHKRNQLFANYAEKAAVETLSFRDKALRYLAKFDRPGVRKGLDPDYIDQIDALLERFDLRKSVSAKELAKRKALVEWVKSQEELGVEPIISDTLLNEANRRHYSEMTAEEFKGLVDAVKNIEHLGRLKHKLLTVQDQREFSAAVDELTKSIKENAKRTLKPQRSTDRGLFVRAGRLFKEFLAMHRKFASIAREMDGWQDGGKAWDYLVRNMNTAGDAEAVDRANATSAILNILSPIHEKGHLGRKEYIAAIDRSLTYEEKLGIALNMGNDINVERVMSGENWNRTQLDSVLHTLDKTDWDFVQKVWDYLESYRPRIAEKERRLTGVEPEWVQASPVHTRYGDYRGGYYPIKYDPLLSTRAEADTTADVQRQMERGLYTRAQTRRGHLKERVASTGRPLRYNLSVISEHLSQVIHDLSWHEYLIDANRMMRNSSIDSAIREHYGPEKLKEMRMMLRDIAVGEVGATDAFEKIIAHLRHGRSIATLGFNGMTALLQPLGITQSISRIGGKWVLRGAMHWLGDTARFEDSVAKIDEKSSMMRMRSRTLQRELSEIRNKIDGKSEIKQMLQAAAFYPIAKLQLVADVPTWWGAYEKAFGKPDMTEARAVALADQAVLDAQLGGQIKDLARIQRGGELMKLFSQFYSFFSSTYNLSVEAVGRRSFRDPRTIAYLSGDLMLLYLIPSMAYTAMKDALGGKLPTPEELIRDLLGFAMSTLVGLRELSGAVSGYDYKGPPTLSTVSDISKVGQDLSQGKFTPTTARAANRAAGAVFHYPALQLDRTVEGANAILEGKTANPGALLVGPPHKK